MILRNLERQPVAHVHLDARHRVRRRRPVRRPAFIDVIEVLIDEQFASAMRQDATVTFVVPRSASAKLRCRAAARGDGRRADPRRTGSAAGGPADRARWRSRVCRPIHISTGSSIATAVCIRSLRRASCSRRCSARFSTCRPDEPCASSSWKGRGRCVTCRSSALVDDSIGLQAYMRSMPCGGCCAKDRR